MRQDELIEKWLKNELTPSEKSEFEALDDADFNQYIVDFASNFKAPETNTFSDFETFKNHYKKTNTKVVPLKGYTAWLKIASVIVVALGVFYFTVLHAPNTTLNTLANQQDSVKLPDDSFVKLNENSELTFNEKVWDKKRELNLIGEAFFDVEKGQRFDVKTKRGTVSVLGTEFNVLSNDSVFKVTCYEGLVMVSINDQKVELPAGNELRMEGNVVETSDVNIIEPKWLKNLSVFNNEPFENVIFELEKQYNVQIEYANPKPINFTGAFENNNLQNALKSITQPFNLTFTIINDNEVSITYMED